MSVTVRFTQRLRFTRAVWSPANTTLIDVLTNEGDGPSRVMVFVDRHVADAQRHLIHAVNQYVQSHHKQIQLACPVQLVEGGEAVKSNPRLLEPMLQQISDVKLDRQSYIIAIGGGATLDAVGFAAGMAHRGIRLVRLPTTTLAQADSGVGVKNGINGFGKKNFLGTFAPPWATINDYDLLSTLTDRDWKCGFVEAVKVGLIKDTSLFDLVAANTDKIRRRDPSIAQPVLQRSAMLHLKHIVEGGDPFELTTARPLDFGHWSAHQLECMTGFRIRHGEAVAIGIALDTVYAKRIGMLSPKNAQRILECLVGLGFTLFTDEMLDQTALLRGIDEFREHLGGRLTLTLLHDIGRSTDVHEVDIAEMTASIDELHAVAKTPVAR